MLQQRKRLRRTICAVSLLALLSFPTTLAAESDPDPDDDGVSPAIPAVGSSGYGWTALPSIAGARIDNSTVVVGENATLLHFIDEQYDPTKIKRVVIQVHGDSRDAWNQWLYADIAAKRAAQGGGVTREEVLVVAPQFFEKIDVGAFPFRMEPRANVTEPATTSASPSTSERTSNRNGDATRSTTTRTGVAARSITSQPVRAHESDHAPEPTPALEQSTAVAAAPFNRTFVPRPPDPDAIVVTDTTEYFSTSQVMIWDNIEWGDGWPALSPPGNGPIGAFEALDELLGYFLDEERFPALNRLVLAGFSLGGQLVQRYATFRYDTSDDERITYWVSSPNSFVYLNSTRPLTPKKACRDSFDLYKYGLDGTTPAYVSSPNQTALTVGQLARRFIGRRVAYLCGVRDTVAGSDDCPSNAQGTNHVSKMVYWTERVIPYLPGSLLNGTLPANSSVHWVSRTGHQDWKIINSDPGVQTLFLEKYNDDGTDAAPPPSNGVVATNSPTAKDSGAIASLSRPSRVALLALVGAGASAVMLL